MKKIIALVRTSTDKQEVESQITEVKNYILRDGYTDENIIVVGGSGASAIKIDEAYKKNINTVYNLIDEGNITAVYAFAIDRIGRNEEVLFHFKNYLVANAVQLVICNPSLRLLNEDGSVNGGVELAFSLFATMAKQEMENKKVRFARGKKRNAENMIYNGGQIRYGYTLDEQKRYIVNKEESDVIITIYNMLLQGKSTAAIANELNERGEQYKGKRFTRYIVHGILTCSAYIGEINGRKYPVILTEKLFNDAAAKLRGNVTIGKNRKNYLCNKLIVCPTCSAHYIRNGVGSYVCINNLRKWDKSTNHAECENNTSAKVEVVDYCALSVAVTVEYHRRTNENEQYKNELLEQIAINQSKIDVLKEKLNSVEDKKAKIAESYIEGLISADTKNAKLEKLKQEIRENTEKIKSLEIQNHKNKKSYDEDENVKLSVLQSFNVDDYETAKTLVKKHVAKIELEQVTAKEKLIKIYTVNGKCHTFTYYPKKRQRKLIYHRAANVKRGIEQQKFVPILY